MHIVTECTTLTWCPFGLMTGVEIHFWCSSFFISGMLDRLVADALPILLHQILELFFHLAVGILPPTNDLSFLIIFSLFSNTIPYVCELYTADIFVERDRSVLEREWKSDRQSIFLVRNSNDRRRQYESRLVSSVHTYKILHARIFVGNIV